MPPVYFLVQQPGRAWLNFTKTGLDRLASHNCECKRVVNAVMGPEHTGSGSSVRSVEIRLGTRLIGEL